MISKPDKDKLRLKCHKRIRGKIFGITERPRLSIFRSNKNIHVQLIDDVEGITLVSASTNNRNTSAEGSKTEQVAEVGEALVETAARKNIKSIVLDRSGHLYHSCVQAPTDATHENGLGF